MEDTRTYMLHTTALHALFDRPIAFHPIFAKMAQSINAGIMLSQAFYWSARTTDADGWFYKSQQEWEEETCLTRREQETARLKLRELGLIEESRHGMPARLYFRINYAQLIDILQIGGKRQSCMAESANHVCTKQPIMSAQNSQSLIRISAEITAETTEEKNLSVSTNVETSSHPAALHPAIPATITNHLDLIELYNVTVPTGIAIVKMVSEERLKKAKKYLRQFPSRDFWVTCFQAPTYSALLRGEKPSPGHEGFKFTFDWLLTKGKDGTENCVKVYEGRYQDASPAQQGSALTAHPQTAAHIAQGQEAIRRFNQKHNL